MYKRILLPLDGSPLAEQALAHAIAQAEHFQAELILLRVLEPLTDRIGKLTEAVRQAEALSADFARDYLKRLAATAEERGVHTQVVTIEGRPYAEIVKFAETNQVDMIVLSTRGQSGLSRWLTGSVADRVMRGAPVPVLLVRTSGTEVR